MLACAVLYGVSLCASLSTLAAVCLRCMPSWPMRARLQDMQRPLYMTPRDAIEYGIADKVLKGDSSESVSKFVGPAGSASASPDGAASSTGFSPGALKPPEPQP